MCCGLSKKPVSPNECRFCDCTASYCFNVKYNTHCLIGKSAVVQDRCQGQQKCFSSTQGSLWRLWRKPLIGMSSVVPLYVRAPKNPQHIECARHGRNSKYELAGMVENNRKSFRSSQSLKGKLHHAKLTQNDVWKETTWKKARYILGLFRSFSQAIKWRTTYIYVGVCFTHRLCCHSDKHRCNACLEAGSDWRRERKWGTFGVLNSLQNLGGQERLLWRQAISMATPETDRVGKLKPRAPLTKIIKLVVAGLE